MFALRDSWRGVAGDAKEIDAPEVSPPKQIWVGGSRYFDDCYGIKARPFASGRERTRKERNRGWGGEDI